MTMEGPRPRVLLIGNFLAEHTDVHNVCYDLRDGLRKAGYDVRFASQKLGRVQRLLDMAGTTWRARRKVDVAQVDVFSGPAFRWAEVVTALLARTATPTVLTLHGGALPEFAARHPGRVRRVLERAATITCPSPFLRRAMEPYAQEIEELPNPVDVDLFEARWRPIQGPRMLWLRSFHRIYDPVLAVRVLAAVRAEHPDATLTMVGSDRDDCRTDVVREAERLGVHEALSMPGSVPHAAVPAMLDAHEVFLNTSRVDNAPVSLIEALACGLPVVSTDAGGIPDLIEHGRTGCLVPVGDADGLAQAVLRLASDPTFARELSEEGRRHSERRYAWPQIFARWESLLASAAHSRPR